MPKTATIKIEVEPELKASVEKILTQLGLSMDTAITIFLRQIILHNKLPFDIPKEKCNFIETKYKAGQTVFVNVLDMKKHGRKTIKATIDYVAPMYIIDEDDGYLEFNEEDVFEMFEEAQNKLKA